MTGDPIGQIPNLVVKRWFGQRLVAWLEDRAASREGVMRGNGGHGAALHSLATHIGSRCDPNRDRHLVILGEIEEALRQGARALGEDVGQGYFPGGEQKRWLSLIGDTYNQAPPTAEPMLEELCAAGARDLSRAFMNSNVTQRKATLAFEAEIEGLKAEREKLKADLAAVDKDQLVSRDIRIEELEKRLEAAGELLEARGQKPRRENVEKGIYVNPSTGRYEALVANNKFQSVDSLEEARRIRDEFTGTSADRAAEGDELSGGEEFDDELDNSTAADEAATEEMT